MHIAVRLAQGGLSVEGEATARFGAGDRTRGPWAAWHWDGARLRAEVDRYGFYPLFRAALPGGIALSDSIAELLRVGVSRDLDDDAIAAFLRLGFFLGDDTPFAAVRAFPPDGRLTRSGSPA